MSTFIKRLPYNEGSMEMKSKTEHADGALELSLAETQMSIALHVTLK